MNPCFKIIKRNISASWRHREGQPVSEWAFHTDKPLYICVTGSEINCTGRGSSGPPASVVFQSVQSVSSKTTWRLQLSASDCVSTDSQVFNSYSKLDIFLHTQSIYDPLFMQ